MQKLNFTFLLTVLLCMVGAKASAYDIGFSNSDGVIIYYNWINNKSELCVTYQGDNFTSYKHEYSGHVVIPQSITYNGRTYPVTTIGRDAFADCSLLKSVTIPNTVKTIEESAFWSCYYLTNIVVPNSVTSIGWQAFRYSGLTSIVIGSSVTFIGEDAFSNCRDLKTVSFHCKNIGNWFEGIKSIREIIIGNEVECIGANAFKSCENLATVTIPNSVTSIQGNPFLDSGIYKNSVNGVFYVDKWACGYKGVMPSNTSIILAAGTRGIANGAFSDYEKLTSVTIPNSITTISSSAFSYCTGLTNVTIPNSVTTIKKEAFRGCSSLTNVTLPNSVTSIENGAFEYCTQLKTINIPLGVEILSDRIFGGCISLSSISIPHNIEKIETNAFSNCSSLSSITIPSSVTSLGIDPFEGCTGIKELIIEDGTQDLTLWYNYKVKNEIFKNCPIESLYLGRYIKEREDYNWLYEFIKGKTSLKSATIGKNITSIEADFFSGCTNLTSVKLPNNVTRICARAFKGCCNIQSLILDDNITYIGDEAFCRDAVIYTSLGSRVLLNLWEIGHVPYEKNTENRLWPPQLVVEETTQTSVRMKLHNTYNEYRYSYGDLHITDLFPETSSSRRLYVYMKDDTEYNGYYYCCDCNYSTLPISLSINLAYSTASSLELKGSYLEGDAKVKSQQITINGVTKEDGEVALHGLNPNSSYNAIYRISVVNSYGSVKRYEYNQTIKTKPLKMTTKAPKVISSGNVIVSAEANLSDEEENVGFEWRRTDWTSDFPSNTGAAALFNETMEGYIRNLNTDKLWKVRPYYLSNSGTYYYGDWMGVDPTNTSYFEPTVHTYAKIEVKGNTALIKGYALQGTDGVKVQGFKYWRRVSKASAEDSDKAMAKRAPNIPSNATTVTSSGQVMTAELANLGYETNYSFVAFVTTNTGETFYGEEQTFTTGANPVGIEGVEISAEEKRLNNAPKYYDMQGHQLNGPIRGLNIVRMADGTVKKVLVK